ncbi:retroviral-like aspartic protease [Roseiflexus sp.]|uniref:retroviral-like aspartic protease n=1 Tax=Roseiflexus sp. TaxID=2562120 RepID=UPI00398B30EC
MTQLVRFPYIDIDPAHPGASRLPYLPLTLAHDQITATLSGLLDSGATVNVLPYPAGLQLGLSWAQQKTPIQLTGNLAQAPARAVVLSATIASFPPVRLAFAWTQITAVPVLLGQVNFFLEFDVCFFRAQSAFEIRPKQNP